MIVAETMSSTYRPVHPQYRRRRYLVTSRAVRTMRGMGSVGVADLQAKKAEIQARIDGLNKQRQGNINSPQRRKATQEMREIEARLSTRRRAAEEEARGRVAGQPDPGLIKKVVDKAISSYRSQATKEIQARLGVIKNYDRSLTALGRKLSAAKAELAEVDKQLAAAAVANKAASTPAEEQATPETQTTQATQATQASYEPDGFYDAGNPAAPVAVLPQHDVFSKSANAELGTDDDDFDLELVEDESNPLLSKPVLIGAGVVAVAGIFLLSRRGGGDK